ncbi:MAG: hypothetical protein AAFY41_00490, partial [Bacteroidota bacterium]
MLLLDTRPQEEIRNEVDQLLESISLNSLALKNLNIDTEKKVTTLKHLVSGREMADPKLKGLQENNRVIALELQRSWAQNLSEHEPIDSRAIASSSENQEALKLTTFWSALRENFQPKRIFHNIVSRFDVQKFRENISLSNSKPERKARSFSSKSSPAIVDTKKSNIHQETKISDSLDNLDVSEKKDILIEETIVQQLYKILEEGHSTEKKLKEINQVLAQIPSSVQVSLQSKYLFSRRHLGCLENQRFWF